MKLETTIDSFHDGLIPVLKELNRKFNHNLVVRGSREYLVPANEGEPNKFFTRADFYDARFPQMDIAGYVKYEIEQSAYVVYSPQIQNDKYRRGSKKYNTRSSKKADAAVKYVLSHIKPFEFSEVMKNNVSAIQNVAHDWSMEHYKGARIDELGYSAREDVYEEVKHLMDMGVVFKTELFRKIQGKYNTYITHMERQKATIMFHHMYFLDDGRVAVTSAIGSAPGNHYANDVMEHKTTIYNKSEDVPESLMSNCALLKVMGGDSPKIPGVGVGTTPQEFYFMEVV